MEQHDWSCLTTYDFVCHSTSLAFPSPRTPDATIPMKTISQRLLALLAWISIWVGSAHAQEKRVALVIGNSGYKHVATLKNPANDVEDMAIALRRLNFQVVEGRDLTKEGMAAKIGEFVEVLPSADIALFFYAGHGIQVDGQNYLVPIEAKLPNIGALDFEMLRLDTIHRAMEREAKASVIFLDACRDNPLTRNLLAAKGTRSTTVGRGLAVMEAGVGSLISFSTQPGNVALDGQGRNSPYASALVNRLMMADQDLSEMLINVRRDVMQATRNEQIPWEHSSLTSRIFFSANTDALALGKSQAHPNGDEAKVWSFVRDKGDLRLIEEFIATYPNGAFLPLAKALQSRLKAASIGASAQTKYRQKIETIPATPKTKGAEQRRQRQEAAAARLEARQKLAATRRASAQTAAALSASAPSRNAGGSFANQFRSIRTACVIDGNQNACRQICAGNPYALACSRIGGRRAGAHAYPLSSGAIVCD
jgi:hypothetical protein